jgi:hypothetical protein
MCSLFKFVDKNIEVFSEGKARKKFFASGFVFERLTFLSKVENRLKRGKNLCESFTREDILNFKGCLDNGNLWFSCLFSFRWLLSHAF